MPTTHTKESHHNLAHRLRQVAAVVMDVDGVLTRGDIAYNDAGEEYKAFSVQDGQGLALLAKLGLPTAIITARTSPIVQQRAADVGVAHVFMGVKNKRQALDELLARLSLPSDQIAYIGDDLPDLLVLQAVGFAACPANASVDVKRVCHFISGFDGGAGCVRQVVDLLVEAQYARPDDGC